MTKRPRLTRDIAIVIVAKLVVLTGLYFAFFGPGHHQPQTSATVAEHLLGTSDTGVSTEGTP